MGRGSDVGYVSRCGRRVSAGQIREAMSDEDTTVSGDRQALLIRLDERVAAITKMLDRQDERINEFADAMSKTAISLRDVVAMQRSHADRIDGLEGYHKESRDNDIRIRQQKLVLVGTMFASLIALLTAAITAYITVVAG